jgi:hypothetical protein
MARNRIWFRLWKSYCPTHLVVIALARVASGLSKRSGRSTLT